MKRIGKSLLLGLLSSLCVGCATLDGEALAKQFDVGDAELCTLVYKDAMYAVYMRDLIRYEPVYVFVGDPVRLELWKEIATHMAPTLFDGMPAEEWYEIAWGDPTKWRNSDIPRRAAARSLLLGMLMGLEFESDNSVFLAEYESARERLSETNTVKAIKAMREWVP